jgi:hypothetical protein
MTVRKHSLRPDETVRPTVISTPRSSALFPGWGVKL